MDTPLLLLLLYFLQNNNPDITNQPLHSLENYMNTMQINPQYTKAKLQIARRIYPLLPTEYAYMMRRSISIVEKTTHLMETAQYLNSYEKEDIRPLQISSKERLQKITSVMQEELKSSNIQNLGMVMDLILNMDRYKKILTTYNQVSRNKDILSDKESIISLMDAFMEGSSDKDKEKLKDLTKMLDIMKLLDSPKKEPNEG